MFSFSLFSVSIDLMYPYFGKALFNYAVQKNPTQLFTVSGTRMNFPRRSRAGARRLTLLMRRLFRPSSGNWL